MLTYRDTNFLKHETAIEKTLSPNLKAEELGGTLKMKGFRVLKEEGEIIYFNNGTYNKTTGVAAYSRQELPFVLKMFENLHKSSTKNLTYWVTTIFGILFLFLAISSFWMYKPSTKMFKRGVYLSITGVSVAVILLVL